MKKISILSLLACLFIFSSCFELIEDLSLNKDGSGNLKVKLNLSASATKIKGVMALDSIDGKAVPSKNDVRDTLQKYKTALLEQPGISAVKTEIDFEYYIINLSIDFDSLVALENAVESLSKKAQNVKWASWNGSQFQRYGLSMLQPVVDKIKVKDKEKLSEATYVSITRFDKEVLKMSNTNAVLAANKKAVMQRFNVLDVINSPESVKNTIEVN